MKEKPNGCPLNPKCTVDPTKGECDMTRCLSLGLKEIVHDDRVVAKDPFVTEDEANSSETEVN